MGLGYGGGPGSGPSRDKRGGSGSNSSASGGNRTTMSRGGLESAKDSGAIPSSGSNSPNQDSRDRVSALRRAYDFVTGKLPQSPGEWAKKGISIAAPTALSLNMAEKYAVPALQKLGFRARGINPHNPNGITEQMTSRSMQSYGGGAGSRNTGENPNADIMENHPIYSAISPNKLANINDRAEWYKHKLDVLAAKVNGDKSMLSPEDMQDMKRYYKGYLKYSATADLGSIA